jgi:hypothetical protein
MNEEQGNQNSPAEENSDNSQENEALGKLNDTALDNEQKPADKSDEGKADESADNEQQTDKEEKKARDFEKGMYKFQDLYKQEKSKREQLEREKQTPTAPENREPTPDEILANATPEEKKGVEILTHIIRKEISQIAGPLEKRNEEVILKEFEDKPYVKELAPQIQAKLNEQPDYLKSQPLEIRLEAARRDAITDNIDTVTQIAVEVGREQGQSNRQLKQNQGGLKGQPARQEGKDDFFKRLETGDVSDEEYKERHDEVKEYYKEQSKKLS